MLVFNKDKSNYYYNIFLENSSYELTKNNYNKFLSKLKMIYYDGIDFSKGIDVRKTNESKECDICHY